MAGVLPPDLILYTKETRPDGFFVHMEPQFEIAGCTHPVLFRHRPTSTSPAADGIALDRCQNIRLEGGSQPFDASGAPSMVYFTMQMPGLVPSIVQFPFKSGTTWDVAASYFCAAMREYLEDVAAGKMPTRVDEPIPEARIRSLLEHPDLRRDAVRRVRLMGICAAGRVGILRDTFVPVLDVLVFA